MAVTHSFFNIMSSVIPLDQNGRCGEKNAKRTEFVQFFFTKKFVEIAFFGKRLRFRAKFKKGESTKNQILLSVDNQPNPYRPF